MILGYTIKPWIYNFIPMKSATFRPTSPFIAYLLIGLFMFGFTGCQATADQGQIKNPPILIRKIGIIRSLGGAKTSSEGTHLLQTDNGDTILLKSKDVDLDDEKYHGKKVDVRGVWLHGNDEQLFDIQNIDIM